jgi:hypothetical protein
MKLYVSENGFLFLLIAALAVHPTMAALRIPNRSLLDRDLHPAGKKSKKGSKKGKGNSLETALPESTSTSPSMTPSPSTTPIQPFANNNSILKTAVIDYIANTWTGYIGDVYHGYVKRRLFASLQNETH